MVTTRDAVVAIFVTLPFLGIEMSPLGNSWAISIIIWIIWLALILAYVWKRNQVRFRSPITLQERGTGETKALPSPVEPEVMLHPKVGGLHDGLWWEWTGRYWGKSIYAEGPFCPVDKITPLMYESNLHKSHTPLDGSDAVMFMDQSTEIGRVDAGRLWCPVCKNTWMPNEALLFQLRDEAAEMLKGEARRQGLTY